MQFFLIYIREAHAVDSRAPMDALVDRLDDAVNLRYGGWPDRLYLIGRDGRVAYAGGKGPMQFKPDEWELAIRRALASTASEAERKPPGERKQ